LIARAIDETVSDVIVSAGQPLWIRTANGLAASGDTIDQQEILGFVDSLLDARRRRCLDESGSVDLAWRHLLSTPKDRSDCGSTSSGRRTAWPWRCGR